MSSMMIGNGFPEEAHKLRISQAVDVNLLLDRLSKHPHSSQVPVLFLAERSLIGKHQKGVCCDPSFGAGDESLRVYAC